MKHITNIDDNNFKYINLLAQQNNTSIDAIINDLIHNNITYPNEQYKNINHDDFKNFSRVFLKYTHEDIASMHDVINSSEEIETDKQMLKVYKYLFQEIAQRNENILKLYEIYKN